ncbi:MAG: hypothetical protein ACRD2U_08395 [Terriglobales bacterium]
MRKLIVPLAVGYLLFSGATTFTQSTEPDVCNQSLTFCWYGPYRDGSDEIDAWGNEWKADDPTEKPIKQVTEVRCVKRLLICIKARNEQMPFGGGTSHTNIDIYNVRFWNSLKVQAVMDESSDRECEQDTLVLNRVEKSAISISSPGPHGNQKDCTSFIGPPKTVVYRLTELGAGVMRPGNALTWREGHAFQHR